MLITSIILFLAAALGGLVMATRIFRDRTPPTAVAVIHGLAAATGLALLVGLLVQGTASTLVATGLGVMAVAALGGFFLLSFHLRGKPHPKPVVVIHALVAVCGVAVLAYALL